MALNYNHLYYFHVAAIEGTVAAAASRLGVTPATVSEQLRALERALGVDLFERLQTGLKLTDAGKLTFEHTSTMFRLGERLVEVLGVQVPNESTHTLRVGTSLGVARSTSTSILVPLFRIRDCAPVIRTGDTVDLLRDLRAGLLDLVLCEGDLPQSMRRGLEVALVDAAPMVAVAAPHVQPSPDWHDVAIVMLRASTSYRRDVDAFLEARGLRPVIAGEADDSLVLVDAAIREGFVVVVPSSIARDALAKGQLRILEHVQPSSHVHIVYQDNAPAALARLAVAAIVAQVTAEAK